MTDTGPSPDSNRSWRLDRRPNSDPADGNLSLHREALPVAGDGEILVRNIYLSIDPTHRIWMSDIDQYMDPVELGEVMRGGTIGVVEQSRSPLFEPGDIVTGQGGWQDYCALSARMVRKIERAPDLPLTAYMGPLGNIGATAYFGLLDIGQPKPGETVVVSAAAGAVGSLVGQIAKLMGCRVVGIAGSDEKCAWLTEGLGFDASINYKNGPIRERLAAACPEGINVYFDNVGGEILDAALTLINLNARIATCGLISTYNDLEQGGQGPKMYRNVLMKRATIRGFIVSDFLRRFPEAFAAIGHWLRIGALQYRVDVRDGLENAPDVLKLLFNGQHDGKLVVQVSEEP